MRTILLISLSLILQNCGTDKIDRVNRVYRIENGTQREITMKFYAFGIFQQTKHIIGEGLIHEGTATNDAGAGIGPHGAINADSLVVIFDNQKMQRFYYGNSGLVINPPEGRNIYDDEEYEIINNELYHFVFTEQDYENAEDCGGNCE